MKVRPAQFLVLALAAWAVPFAFGPDPAPPSPLRPPPDAAPLSELVWSGLSSEAQLRLFAKTLVARDAAAGRLTLREAAGLFCDLNRLPPATPPPGRPGQADAERQCRQVIEYVRGWSPAGPGATVDRLESELRQALREPGGLRLPDAAALPPLPGLLERASAELLRCRPVPGVAGP
jgi:hypothetical protein